VKFPAPIQAIIGLVAAILSAAIVHEILHGFSLHAYQSNPMTQSLAGGWVNLSKIYSTT
jgi:hypothetical protein